MYIIRRNHIRSLVSYIDQELGSDQRCLFFCGFFAKAMTGPSNRTSASAPVRTVRPKAVGSIAPPGSMMGHRSWALEMGWWHGEFSGFSTIFQR